MGGARGGEKVMHVWTGGRGGEAVIKEGKKIKGVKVGMYTVQKWLIVRGGGMLYSVHFTEEGRTKEVQDGKALR